MPEPPLKKQKSSSSSSSSKHVSSDVFLERIKGLREDAASSISDFSFNKNRVRTLTPCKKPSPDSKGVLYWMSRDQRVQDNWALLYSQKLALDLEVPLYINFCLVPKFLEATIRQFGFMLKGLQEVEKECKSLRISFHLHLGHATDHLPQFVEDHNIGAIVTDFCPLRVPTKWVTDLVKSLPDEIPLFQVDAHNIVPCWEASPKQEYGARTIRNKIHNQLSKYFTEFPPVIQHAFEAKAPCPAVDWIEAEKSLEVDRSVKEVDWATPGTTAGLKNLESFIQKRLGNFDADRNNPNKNALSNMSPWFHFGHVAPQRAMLMVNEMKTKYSKSVAAYIEEGVIRRELCDNYCFYQPNYDNIDGAYEWARLTLKAHRKDKREYVYSKEQLEKGKTHDDLWNAAQTQLLIEGKMHGFLRMYWAKKILEWTETPERGLEEAIYLNDKYSLDGRDPNGYVGCMWSICGIHDQGWAERAVFGKIRFMNYNGCKRKFDVAAFVSRYRTQAAKLK
ncbi:hypothetical protein CAPTEDRAFT_152478 [Capitella teleta]|uniref:Deoxyribodipyrimidine photo-lyase n=1 Tax=Capitella teleta TaxID=283909 RepID=R7TV65_CAPTE|nr:hypothetical protein CAPTEDRAFT_152478 [Capitella teleta]|eukprot:ELT97477.1 hypothetical protein CAPTEDRAFT_152478 [Capitella teleta]